jgi:hypothetical protein
MHTGSGQAAEQRFCHGTATGEVLGKRLLAQHSQRSRVLLLACAWCAGHHHVPLKGVTGPRVEQGGLELGPHALSQNSRSAQYPEGCVWLVLV